MAIKLTPEHVGGRVLLSDGDVAWICRFHDEHVSVTGGLWIEFFDLNGAHSAEGSEYRITLLLDAPNPMNVEVPEWCEQVLLWFDGVGDFVCWGDIVTMESRAAKMSETANSACEGWSPAPGQMPPREDA